MSSEEHDEMVRLATAPTAAQGHIWQNALEAEGIRCRVVGDFLEGGIGDIPGVMAELWVARADLPRAEAILREHEERPEEGSPEG